MGVRWRGFEMPKVLVCDEATLSPEYGKFIAEPFERGYGVTLGNALRRVLISSIEGAAVTSVKIEGAMHEFSSIPGVVEDVAQIILNIKKLVLKSHSRDPKVITLRGQKKGIVTAKDIIADETIEILNPDLPIATLSKKISFNVDMEINKGRGYVIAERNKKENQPIGYIAVDSVFSPVRRVNFNVENTRVGQVTDYDKLILEIWTNGSIDSKEALIYASNIFQRHLDVFVGFGGLPEEDKIEETNVEEEELTEKLNMPVSELELSVRSANCLKDAKIKTIGDLVKKSEIEMLKYRNFGKKSLSEIKAIIGKMNLDFGIKLKKKKES